ncbi:MAG: hypothetical protein J5695_08190 [Bacteroidales bacterium]|nr:hypothetical protein [Bacteroidales bacterium]MBO4567191.1 hypothetical protein [Bacteroidales bacterium]
MKKAFFRLMGIVLGLNVFTACYGPAPGGEWEYEEATEQTDESEEEEETKAADEAQLPE